jgi:uncharacterized protein
VLMLRGPQTPGELKQRAERMHGFEDLGAVHAALASLIERGLAARLERRPGQKEERYRQLLEQEESLAEEAIAPFEPAHPAPPAADQEAVQAPAGTEDLLRRVERLEREVVELRAAMRDPVVDGQP